MINIFKCTILSNTLVVLYIDFLIREYSIIYHIMVCVAYQMLLKRLQSSSA